MLVKADFIKRRRIATYSAPSICKLCMKPVRISTTLPLKQWTISNHDLHDQIAATTRL